MSLPIAIDTLISASWYCYCVNQLSVNTVLYRVQTVTGTPTDSQLADAMAEALSTEYKALLPSSASYKGASCRIEWGTGIPLGGPSHYSAEGAGVGVAEGNVLPLQTCGIITKLSNVRGPGGRGRIYVPFPADSFQDVSGSPIAATYGPLLTALGTNLIGIDGINITFVTEGDGEVVVRSLIKAPFPDTPLSDVLTDGYLIRDKWGVQHRRGDYGTPNQLIA